MNKRVGLAVCLILTTASLQAQERRGWFGITVSCEECYILRGGPDRVAYFRFPAVTSVENGSPAHQAGMRRGDTIIAVEGLPLTTPEGFQRYAEARPNQPIRVTVRVAGNTRELTVTPAERAGAATIRDFYNSRLRIAQRHGPEALRGAFRMPMGTLGMVLECERCDSYRPGNWRFLGPAPITMVDVDGPAHQAGLRRGDTVLAIEGHFLTSLEGTRLFSQLEPGQRVMLTIRRGGQERRIPVTAAPRPDVSRDELALFEEYRRYRDSVEALRRAELAMMAEVAEIQVAPRLLRMQPGAQVQLSATVYGPDGMPRIVPVRWQSNNINVVEVGQDGVARAVAPGTAIVQAVVQAGGRRRVGQATVMVQGSGAPALAPLPPGVSGTPGAPTPPRVFVRAPNDSMIRASVNCAEPAISAINPARACYDERAEPRGSTMVEVPAACIEQVGPATVNVHVTEDGQATDVQPFAPSNCHEFTEAAMRVARGLTYTPARKDNAPVRSWLLLRLRPLPRQP